MNVSCLAQLQALCFASLQTICSSYRTCWEATREVFFSLLFEASECDSHPWRAVDKLGISPCLRYFPRDCNLMSQLHFSQLRRPTLWGVMGFSFDIIRCPGLVHHKPRTHHTLNRERTPNEQNPQKQSCLPFFAGYLLQNRSGMNMRNDPVWSWTCTDRLTPQICVRNKGQEAAKHLTQNVDSLLEKRLQSQKCVFHWEHWKQLLWALFNNCNKD